MVIDYSKFKSVELASSSGEEDEGGQGSPESGDALVGGARSEEGLLRAFIAIHERRLEVDGMCSAAKGAFALEAAAEAYDDVCARLLVLDGVRHESELRSLGHRAEAARARRSAAQAHLSAGNLREAETRASLAIAAIRRDKEDPEAVGQTAGQGRRLLYDNAVDAYLCRAEARLLRGLYKAAREDALVAYATAQRRGEPEQVKASSALAVRCEMALTAGGPGPDGKGEPVPLEEIGSLEVHSLGACEAEAREADEEAEAEGEDEVGKADDLDLQAMD